MLTNISVDISVNISAECQSCISQLLVEYPSRINRLFWATDLILGRPQVKNHSRFVRFLRNRPQVKSILCLTYVLGVTVLGLTNGCQVKDRPRFALSLSTVLDLLPTTTSTNFGNHTKVSFVSMDGVGRQRLNRRLNLSSLSLFSLSELNKASDTNKYN